MTEKEKADRPIKTEAVENETAPSPPSSGPNPQPTLASSAINKFDEYKLFVDDTARFTERRLTVTNIFVAVNSILLGGIALLIKDAGIATWAIKITVLLLLCAGIGICGLWAQIITKYKKLIGLRMRELKKMENHPEMAGCHQMYILENELYPENKPKNIRDGSKTARN